MFQTCSPIQVRDAHVLLNYCAVVLDDDCHAALGTGVAPFFCTPGHLTVWDVAFGAAAGIPSSIDGIRRQAEQRAARISADIYSEAPDGFG